ncbi:uncharacterized protein EV154DRAFT_492425 [Mucor mucedo]|uniref:uncharacterized protein n=1 Tax=Mucor mucedo TaxID=29922 RepID=UPI00221ED7AE|nr:uncharacterized protein EV154DRAFT_492425 [Mucor mucedo]KAI7896477.1 hypothetical protein EV154DRAFT_492425 [Mucor mucedo]
MFLKEPRKIIGVDLDQTLAHTLESLTEWHNDSYGTQLKVTDFNSLDYWKIWGGTKEESCMKVREFYDSVHFEQIQPIRDFALEALKMLKRRNFTLVIITSRQQFVAEKTKRFVDRHYPGIFESIYFCNLNLSDTEQMEYISKPKSVICQEIGVDVLIDDSLEHAFDCSNLGIDILLYDHKGKYSWNHEECVPKKKHCPPTLTSTSKRLYGQHTPHEISKNIHRMMNWRDIIAQFPKPTSPLRYCYFPDSFTEEEDSVEEDDDAVFDSPNCRYETVEVEMSDDEDWNNWV